LGISIIGSLFLLHSCKDDCPPCDDPTNPDCDNYDPCYNYQPALGLDTISQIELFKIYFPINSWITVTMVAKVDPSNCLTTEQLSDTLTKRFYVVQNCCDTAIDKSNPWWGTWQGANMDNPEEVFTISWGYIGKRYKSSGSFDFTGLPKGIPVQWPFYSSTSASITPGTDV